MKTPETDSIDSLLQLHFGSRKTTDRKTSILDRLSQNDLTDEEEVRFVEATSAALKDLAMSDAFSLGGSQAAQVAAPAVAHRSPVTSRASGSRFAAYLVLLAASFVLVVVGIRYWQKATNQRHAVPNPSDYASSSSSSIADSSAMIAEANQQDSLEFSTENEIVRSTESKNVAIVPETLSAGGPLVDAKPRRLDWTEPVHEDVVPTPAPIDWQAIVANLNSLASDLWKSSGLDSPSRISAREWALRAVHVILDRSPTQQELDEIAKIDSLPARKAWLERLVASNDFARAWSRHLATAWIGHDDASPERRAFEVWLAEQIENRKPLGAIQSEFLKTQGGDGPDAADFRPATHWLLSVYRAAHPAAGEVGRLLLGQQIGCARCHDDGTAGLSQKDYWGLQAFLEQIQFDRESRGDYQFDQLRWREMPQLFYSRPDGAQALAIPRLPNSKARAGATTEESIELLASWLQNHPSRRTHNVDIVWKAVFGAPLVPYFGLSSEEGRLQREGMRNLLGEQVAAYGDTLQHLVIWVVLSDPFCSEDVSLGVSQENLASQSLRDRLRVQRFQAFRPIEDRKWDQPQQRMRTLAQLYQFSSPTILSQPLPNLGPATSSDAGRLEARLKQLLLEDPIPMEMGAAIDRFAASSMKWEWMIDHTYWRAGYQNVGREEKELANKVLSASEDRRQALIRVVRTFGL